MTCFDLLDSYGRPNPAYQGLHAWYRADSGVLTSTGQAGDGDEVVAWENYQKDNNRDLNEILGTGSLPTFKANAIADLPAVKFRNAAGLKCSDASWGTLANGVTVFAVVQLNNISATDYIFDSANYDDRNMLCSHGDTQKWFINSGTRLYTGDVQAGQFLVHEVVFDSAGSRHLINGELAGQGDAGTEAFAGLSLGGHVLGGGNFLDGYVAELLVYNGSLDDDQRMDVRRYLLSKYGLGFACGVNQGAYHLADINQDCRVDLDDYAEFAFGWLLGGDELALGNPARRPFLQEKVTVFELGMDGVYAYRIPSLVTTQNGTLLAFCEARKYSSADLSPTMLVVRRSTNMGKTWSDMQILHDVGNGAATDMVSVVDRQTGRAIVVYQTIPEDWSDNMVTGFGSDSSRQWCVYSDDDGETWSAPINITTQIKDPLWYGLLFGPGIGIQTQKGTHPGRLVLPARCRYGQLAVYSDDHGDTWYSAPGLIDQGSIECQIVELENSDYLMNLRSSYGGNRWISTSSDGGNSWSPGVSDDELTDLKCQASIIRYSWADEGESIILYTNPAKLTERKRLTIRASYDDCQTWPVSKCVGPEYSGYSCLTVLRDKTIGCLYESGPDFYYQTISFVRFNYEWLLSAD